MQTKITHLTSAHPRYDTRIFIKMCCSLAKLESYKVNLVVADGKGDEYLNDVNIFDIGAKNGGRLSRMTTTVSKVFDKAVKLESDIYHLHDPELIPIGLRLKKLGKKIIFDAHEDVSKQILSKHYLNKYIRVILSKVFGMYETRAFKKFDAIVGATPYIRGEFLKINTKTVDINNFPIVEELGENVEWNSRKTEACYIGAIAEIRGIKEIVKAIGLTKNCRLNLAGKFVEASVEKEVKEYAGWNRVNELGFVGREEIKKILQRSKVGLVTLHPIINYQDALPVKMFEYMVAGIPVVSSDVKLWKSIVDDANCGLCVNPLEPEEITNAIDYLISNDEVAKRMGENGKKAVIEKYNWRIEEKKLYELYESIV
ncbi:glycosyltransferase [Sulfurimonas aquatica]|uniref:Glycosyltransferase n=1 Tax=Sulfurimonas aquatica TaxID=2672570 RepID=A0A975AZH8_9BACT|nr:glycosyltransferase family 4 protein [Sulfurimonas aquatica]QSZ41442.1 glycosyltransferase [Sulfurimonas aquatica]